MIQFNEHMFQMGRFKHQLVRALLPDTWDSTHETAWHLGHQVAKGGQMDPFGKGELPTKLPEIRSSVVVQNGCNISNMRFRFLSFLW